MPGATAFGLKNLLRLCNCSLLRKAELPRLPSRATAMIIKQQLVAMTVTLVIVVDLRLN
jgi:hypothetical protein